MKPGVRPFPNHEPKVRLGILTPVPASERRELRAAMHRLNRSTRVPAGAFAKNARPHFPIDPRQPAPPAVMRWACEWKRQVAS